MMCARGTGRRDDVKERLVGVLMCFLMPSDKSVGVTGREDGEDTIRNACTVHGQSSRCKGSLGASSYVQQRSDNLLGISSFPASPSLGAEHNNQCTWQKNSQRIYKQISSLTYSVYHVRQTLRSMNALVIIPS